MRKLIFIIPALLLTAITSFSQHRVIAVGFYNCENFFDTIDDSLKLDEDFTPGGDYRYTEKVYAQKLSNVARVIKELGTDITPEGAGFIGLAEVENDRVLTDLIAQPEIKDRNYKFIWYPTPDVRGISTAFLYNPKQFRVISSMPVKVPLEQLGQPRPTRDILFVKGVLAANDTVHILVNHWPSRSGGEDVTRPYRNFAASVAKGIFDSLLAENREAKIFIMGDLNDNPTDESIRKVMKARADTIDIGSNEIFNPWISIFKKGTGTETFNGEWNLLDQIMISGAVIRNSNEKWKYLRNKIFNKPFLTQDGVPHRSFDINRNWDNGFSDHYPILVYLYYKVKQAQAATE